MSFFEELKRRNVFRVGIAYLISAWLLLQLTEVLSELLTLPEGIGPIVVGLVVVGFPIVLVVAWAFELTPEGIKKEREVDRSESITPNTGRKLDRMIIVVLVFALGYFVWEKLMLAPGINSAEPTAAVGADQDAANSIDKPQEKSVAVLPFANRSSREEDAFFADGIHDDLLTSLAKIGSLKVISRTSVMRYRGTEMSIPEIAEELGVSAILEGGIQRSGDHVRINVQLIDANDDAHLWAENYDRVLTAENLFAIQSEMSREIVAALQANLTDEESSRLDERPTDSLEAFSEFVLGRQQLAERTNVSLVQAQKHFEKAIELDPEYVLAYVGLADAVTLQVSYGDIYIVDSFAPRQAALDKALALDPNSGEAYTSLANLRDDQDQDEAAETFYQKAIELSSNYTTAWHWYALFLNTENREEEALVMIDRAIELDPNAPILAIVKAGSLWALDRREEALAVNQAQLQQTPNFPNLYAQRAGFLGSMGQLGKAMLWIQGHANLDATSSNAPSNVCTMWVHLGSADEAERCYDRAEEAYPEASFGDRILLHQLRGDNASALALMKQIAERYPFEGAHEGLGWMYLLNGDFSASRLVVEEWWPQFLGKEPIVVDENNRGRAQLAAFALYYTGDVNHANQLLDQVLAFEESQRYPGYGPVFIHALRQDHDKAVAALRKALDSGARFNWFRLRFSLFDSMLEDPEWVNLIAELEADIAAQRRWYLDNQDQPLL